MVLRHVLGLMTLEEVKGALEHPADAAGRALFERNAFYRARLKKFCREFNARQMGSLTSLEIDEHPRPALACRTARGIMMPSRWSGSRSLPSSTSSSPSQSSASSKSRASGDGIEFRALPKPRRSWRRRRRRSG